MQDLSKQQEAVADCEARLAALPYDADAAAELEATVEAEKVAVRGAGERVDVLSSQLAGGPLVALSPATGRPKAWSTLLAWTQNIPPQGLYRIG